MKSTFFLMATLTVLVFTISSCNIDNPLDPNNPANPEFIILEDRYTTDITLTDHNEDGVDYIATDEVLVAGGEMTIEPGVIIEFEGGAYLHIAQDGKLNAVGSSTAPIRMVADQNEPTWAGIYINTDKNNKIHHCIIDNAGSGTAHGIRNQFKSAIAIEGKVSVENTTITNSGEVGVVAFDTDSEITSFDGNSIKDCATYPIATNINLLMDLNLTDNIYADNGNMMINVFPFFGGEALIFDTTIEGLEIPYLIDGEFRLEEDLTLNRGVEFVMGDNSLLLHRAEGNYRFEIKGTESDHVVIRGQEPGIGYWQGMYIASNNSGNVFEYLDISDGGGENLTLVDGKANISLEIGGNLTMVNCTSARSGNCDIFVSNLLADPTFTNESPSITEVCIN